MRVVAGQLVLDEVVRPVELADVVVERAGMDQDRVAVDRLDPGLGQVGDRQRMLEGARRLEGQPAQQRHVGIGQLDQLDRGGDAEEGLEDRHRKGGDRGGQEAADEAAAEVEAELGEAAFELAAHRPQGEHRGGVDPADHEGRLGHHRALAELGVVEREDPGQRGCPGSRPWWSTPPRRR